jgi:hypothetical protein
MGWRRISDQSVNKRLRKINSKKYGDRQTIGPTNQLTDRQTDRRMHAPEKLHSGKGSHIWEWGLRPGYTHRDIFEFLPIRDTMVQYTSENNFRGA